MNLKALIEKRNALVTEMQGLIDTATTETRAFKEEESTRFHAIKDEIDGIDKVIKAADEARAFEGGKPAAGADEQRALDETNFIAFIRGETRALNVSNNGGIVPETIANRIIETVKEICPIYNMVDVYNVGGDLVFPVYNESYTASGTTHKISAAYVDDLTELTEDTSKFTTVKLENFIIGCLTKVSKSLMNRTDFDLLGFVVHKVAEAIAEFLEKELLIGTENKMTGASSTMTTTTAASASAITADELIDVQMLIKEPYQAKAVWIMHRNTLKAIRKLKDSNGNYLLNKDITAGYGYELLGKHVYLSAQMPEIGASAKPILYGDMTGLALKLAQGLEIQILLEKYATQHAVGIVAYIEADSDILEHDKIASLAMAAA